MRFALHRGIRVIATTGRLGPLPWEQIGVQVTAYGEGMVERVGPRPGHRAERGRIDRADQPSPGGGSLPALIELTGDPDRVLTVSDLAAAAELDGRITTEIRYDRMGEFAPLAGEGVLAGPVARTYPLDRIREAAGLSQSRRQAAVEHHRTRKAPRHRRGALPGESLRRA